MPNQIERDAFVKRDVLKNPIPYTRGTDLLPIVIHFRDFQIPSGATARVFVAKSDGNAVYTTATIDGNDVTIDVQGQMFIELGTALMQISIMDGDEELCTFVQPVNVEPNLKAGDFPASGNDITFLDDAIEQANQGVNTATTAAEKASAAVQNANTAISNANKAISDLNAQIATLENNFASLAQTVEISQLQTVAKTLAGAVNELNSKSSNLTYGKSAIPSIKAQAEGMSGSRSVQIFLIQNEVTTDIPMNSSGFCFIFEYGGGTGCVFTFHNNGDIYVAGKSNSVLGDFRKVQIGS